MNKKLVFLDQIDFKRSPLVRAGEPHKETVEQYAENYAEKKDMPPIVLFYDIDSKTHLLADGRHRCHAMMLLKRNAIPALVHEGNYVEALKYALLANSVHGLPRSNADKRRCVEAAIMQWPELSSQHLSKMTDVSDKTVSTIREELVAANKVEKSLTRKTVTGKTISATVARKSEPEKDEDEDKPRVTAAPLIKDALDRQIPTAVVKYWNRSDEIKGLMDQVGAIIGALKRAQTDNDTMFAEVNISGTIADLEKAFISIRTAVPYSICTTCQGHPETQKSGCRMCLGRGLISKFRYDSLVTEETKKILAKGKK